MTQMLKGCPFCGSRDVELRVTITDALVACNKCGCRTGLMFLGKDDASNAFRLREVSDIWNNRASSIPKPEATPEGCECKSYPHTCHTKARIEAASSDEDAELARSVSEVRQWLDGVSWTGDIIPCNHIRRLVATVSSRLSAEPEAGSSDEDAEARPANCRFRLQDEGKPYPRSACQACGAKVTTGLGKSCPRIASRLSAEPEAVTLREAGLIERLAVSVDAFVLVHTNDAELAINAGNHVREAAADHRAALTNVSSRAPK